MELKNQIYLSLSLPILLAACDNGDPAERLQASHLPPEGFVRPAQQRAGIK